MPKKAKQTKKDYFVHPTAIIEDDVLIGQNTKIWHFAHIRRGTKIGQNCIIGKAVFLDFDCQIGNNVKIQNHAILYHRALIADGVFIGPNVCFTNDKRPRAINPDGTLKSADDWGVSTIEIGQGASIGGHCVLVPGVKIGAWSMAGAGSVVTKEVPPFALVYGNPAKVRDFVCKCGQHLKEEISRDEKGIVFHCGCGLETAIPKEDYKLKEAPSTGEKKKIWLR